MENSTKFPDPVLGKGEGEEGKFVFVLRKCSKTLLQQCRILKFFLDLILGKGKKGGDW